MTPCDEWSGTRLRSGYGVMGLAGTKVYAHRLVWMQDHGTISDNLVVRHSCDNPSCVNIDHLSIGTHGDNARDRDERGRTWNGRSNWKTCINGHAFSSDNTYLTPDGRRNCRKCRKQARQNFLARKAG